MTAPIPSSPSSRCAAARGLAAVLAVLLVAAAAGAQAGPRKKPLEVAVVAVPEGSLSVDAVGAPITGIVDLDPGVPPGVTQSTSFDIPEDGRLALDWVGARLGFDRELPAGERFALFIEANPSLQTPIVFAEASGNEIHFGGPVPIVLEGGGSLRFFVLGSFGGATVQSARYSFSGRVLPVE
jgi:hypothetical protein